MENCFWPQEYECLNQSQNENVTYLVPSWLSSQDTVAIQKCPYYPPVVGEATVGSKSHSESEKRRRDRINAQFATLRKLIPNSEKMDKAALLGHVVEHVKELSRKAKAVTNFTTVPSETDEITIDYFNQEQTSRETQVNESFYVKASVCCDDRTELSVGLNRVFEGLGFTIVQAELTSLGGRMMSSFVLRSKYSLQSVGKRHLSMDSLKRSLNLALSRIRNSSTMPSYSARSKRQRFFYLDSH